MELRFWGLAASESAADIIMEDPADVEDEALDTTV